MKKHSPSYILRGVSVDVAYILRTPKVDPRSTKGAPKEG